MSQVVSGSVAPANHSLRRTERLLIALYTLSVPSIAVMLPKFVVPMFVALVVLLLAVRWRRGAVLWPTGGVAILLGLFLLWSLIASFYAPSPPDSLEKWLRLAVLLLLGLMLLRQIAGSDPETRRLFRLALFVGCGFALAFLLFEGGSGRLIHRLVEGENREIGFPLFRLNRGATALALFVWPIALSLWSLGQRWLAGVLPLALLGLLAFYDSAAAVAGLAAGMLIVPLCRLRPRRTPLLVAGLAAVLLLGAPVLAKGLAGLELHREESLPYSMRHRVHFWSFIADRFAERPLLGWGFDSSSRIPRGDAKVFQREAKSIIPSHPHNTGLQLLLELGLVGGLLATTAICLLAGGLGLGRPQDLASAAAITTSLVIASTAYGLWQSQWIVVLFTTAAFLRLSQAEDAAGSDSGERAGERRD